MKNPLSFLGALLALIGLTGTAAAEVAVGDEAPGFRLQDQRGDWHELTDYRGRWVALYFYPKDDTPGCTTEACAFRDNIFAFEDLGAIVMGVSLDDVESHEAFAEKYSLPFPLLADVDAETAKDYGVLGNFMGMKLAKRQSFLIDPEGRVAKHYRKVNPSTHTEEVLADLRSLASDNGPAG